MSSLWSVLKCGSQNDGWCRDSSKQVGGTCTSARLQSPQKTASNSILNPPRVTSLRIFVKSHMVFGRQGPFEACRQALNRPSKRSFQDFAFRNISRTLLPKSARLRQVWSTIPKPPYVVCKVMTSQATFALAGPPFTIPLKVLDPQQIEYKAIRMTSLLSL